MRWKPRTKHAVVAVLLVLCLASAYVGARIRDAHMAVYSEYKTGRITRGEAREKVGDVADSWQ